MKIELFKASHGREARIVITEDDDSMITVEQSKAATLAGQIIHFAMHGTLPELNGKTIECSSCGRAFDEGSNEIAFREDPFASEIRNDHTERWICDQCVHESEQDI